MGENNTLPNGVFGLVSSRAYNECAAILDGILENIPDGKTQAAIVSSVGLMLAASALNTAADTETADDLAKLFKEQFDNLLAEARSQLNDRLMQAAE